MKLRRKILISVVVVMAVMLMKGFFAQPEPAQQNASSESQPSQAVHSDIQASQESNLSASQTKMTSDSQAVDEPNQTSAPEAPDQTSADVEPRIFPPQELVLLDGKINPVKDERFKRLPDEYTMKPSFVQVAVYDDLLALLRLAKKDNIPLKVLSAFRSYEHQKAIWDRKWQLPHFAVLPDEVRVSRILAYSSLPATSRHHWGTDVDFNSVEEDYWKQGEGLRVHRWLQKNAKKHGFCQTYAGKKEGKRVVGYEDEAWHWSHIATARPLQRQRAQSLQHILDLPINGSEVIKRKPEKILDLITSISSECDSR